MSTGGLCLGPNTSTSDRNHILHMLHIRQRRRQPRLMDAGLLANRPGRRAAG